MPLNREMTQAKQQLIAPVVSKIKKYLTHGFYFAHNFPITINQQSFARGAKGPHIMDNVDIRYMWNFNLCKDLIAQSVPMHWCIPLIQGYADY